MKKLLASIVIMTICAFAANAQDAVTPTTVPAKPTETKSQMGMQRKEAMKEKWENASPEEREKMKARKEKWENASPEQKARMEKHHAMMEKLSPAQREEVKKEKERHRAEMKKITGRDDMVMQSPEDSGVPANQARK